MIDLKEVLAEWANDNQIHETHLDESSRKTPILHSKYLEKLANAKLLLKKAEFSQKTLLKEKWLYYNGKMDQEQIEKLGWDPDPFDGLKILKGEMDYYYDADPEIQKSEEKIQYFKTLVETLTDIVDTIKWRHQTISNIIKWKQFQSGN
jgi:hypothetical protein|tara:strand:+ start:1621 stop:2067 length:447 start_codon:yes stop_codon:yes gene_type:complete